jgi:hypothetical protein
MLEEVRELLVEMSVDGGGRGFVALFRLYGGLNGTR